MTKLTSFDSLPWKTFKCAKNQIRLDIVLKCGQSFRWSQYESTQSWIGVMSDTIWLIRQNEEQIQYKTITNAPNSSGNDTEAINSEEDILKEYFQLNVDLEPLYKVNSYLKMWIILFFDPKNFRRGRLFILSSPWGRGVT